MLNFPRVSHVSLTSFAALVLFSTSCGSSRTARTGDGVAAKTQAVEDAVSMTRGPDGIFDVVCRDGSKERRTAVDVRKGRVCEPKPTPTPSPSQRPVDPFDPRSCEGQDMSEQNAFARIPLPGATSVQIGTAVMKLRTRLCLSVDGCAPWDTKPSWSKDDPRSYNSLFFAHEWDSPTTSTNYAPRLASLPGNQEALPVVITLEGDRPAWMVSLGSVTTDFFSILMGASVGGQTFGSAFAIPYADFWHRGGQFTLAKSSPGFGFLSVQNLNSDVGTDRLISHVRPLNLQGKLTNHCLRLAARNTIPMTFSQGNTGTFEQEFVIFSKF